MVALHSVRPSSVRRTDVRSCWQTERLTTLLRSNVVWDVEAQRFSMVASSPDWAKQSGYELSTLLSRSRWSGIARPGTHSAGSHRLPPDTRPRTRSPTGRAGSCSRSASRTRCLRRGGPRGSHRSRLSGTRQTDRRTPGNRRLRPDSLHRIPPRVQARQYSRPARCTPAHHLAMPSAVSHSSSRDRHRACRGSGSLRSYRLGSSPLLVPRGRVARCSRRTKRTPTPSRGGALVPLTRRSTRSLWSRHRSGVPPSLPTRCRYSCPRTHR